MDTEVRLGEVRLIKPGNKIPNNDQNQVNPKTLNKLKQDLIKKKII
jgi:hypothetical protein